MVNTMAEVSARKVRFAPRPMSRDDVATARELAFRLGACRFPATVAATVIGAYFSGLRHAQRRDCGAENGTVEVSPESPSAEPGASPATDAPLPNRVLPPRHRGGKGARTRRTALRAARAAANASTSATSTAAPAASGGDSQAAAPAACDVTMTSPSHVPTAALTAADGNNVAPDSSTNGAPVAFSAPAQPAASVSAAPVGTAALSAADLLRTPLNKPLVDTIVSAVIALQRGQPMVGHEGAPEWPGAHQRVTSEGYFMFSTRRDDGTAQLCDSIVQCAKIVECDGSLPDVQRQNALRALAGLWLHTAAANRLPASRHHAAKQVVALRTICGRSIPSELYQRVDAAWKRSLHGAAHWE